MEMEEILNFDIHNARLMAMHICEYILTAIQGQTKSENLDTYAFLLAMLTSPAAENMEDRVSDLMINALRAREYLAKTFDFDPDCEKNPQK